MSGEFNIKDIKKVKATRYIWHDGNETDELMFVTENERIVISFDKETFSKIVAAIEQHDLHDSSRGIDEVF